MSLKTRFKNLGNILATDETQQDVFVLESPVLSTGMYERLLARLGEGVQHIDCTFRVDGASGNGAALKDALSRIETEAEDAVRAGREHIVLTDEHQGAESMAIPMILATGAVHSHLVSQGLRTFCSITVRSAECPGYALLCCSCRCWCDLRECLPCARCNCRQACARPVRGS